MEIQLFSKFVKDLYALCLDRNGINTVLNDLVSLLQCRSVGLHVVHFKDFHVVSDTVSTDSDEALREYDAHFSALRPHQKKYKELERKTTAGSVFLFNHSDFFLLKPEDQKLSSQLSELSMFSLLFREGDILVQLVIQRKEGHLPGYADLAKYSNLLLPHIHKTFELYHALESAKGYSTGFEQAMDCINSGLILFDRHMKPVFRNRKALETLSNAKGFSVISGKIVGPTPQESIKLRELITAAIASGGDASKKGVGMMTVQAGHTGRREIALIAIPLHPRILSLLDGETGVFAALMIDAVQPSSDLNPDMLHLLYGLTQAEARLAVCLSGGKSLEQCSESYDISMNTARSYLKLIFQKTETSRQGELVALLKNIPVPNGKPHTS